jgi:hypothetical protein
MPSSTTISPRTETAAVRRYLDHLATPKPRGRYATREGVQAQLAKTQRDLVDATNLDRVLLIQQRMDLEARLADMSDNGDPGEDLERDFVEHGFNWAQRQNVSYSALRQVGVPARVLREAGWS